MPRLPAPVGAHISVAGGLARALPRIAAVEAEAAQVFVANPRGWAPPPVVAAEDEAFGATCPVPVYVHAPYLINFGSPSPDTLKRSREALRFSLRRAAAIGAFGGVVVHAGSAVLSAFTVERSLDDEGLLAMSWDASVSKSTRHEPGLGDDINDDVR